MYFLKIPSDYPGEMGEKLCTLASKFSQMKAERYSITSLEYVLATNYLFDMMAIIIKKYGVEHCTQFSLTVKIFNTIDPSLSSLARRVIINYITEYIDADFENKRINEVKKHTKYAIAYGGDDDEKSSCNGDYYDSSDKEVF